MADLIGLTPHERAERYRNLASDFWREAERSKGVKRATYRDLALAWNRLADATDAGVAQSVGEAESTATPLLSTGGQSSHESAHPRLVSSRAEGMGNPPTLREFHWLERAEPMIAGLNNSGTGGDLERLAQGAKRTAELLRVLVVEDEILLRMTTADELRESGFCVLEARNGDEAITLLRKYANVDAVLSDIRMPGMTDGIALAGLVKQLSPGTRMFLTSGTPLPANSEHAAHGFFPKPYLVGEVARVIRNACLKAGSRTQLPHESPGD